MRTDLGNGLVVDTNGYDAVAEIESTGDKYGTAKYIRERKKECEEQARKYLAEHPKTTYYIASGYPTMMAHDDDVPDSDYRSLIAYTEEEIKRIKELIVEVWNNEDPNSPIQSVDDIDDFNLSEWEGLNDELDELLFERAAWNDFVMTDLDMDHPVHAYRFRTWKYSKRTDEMEKYKGGQRVILTDEEYLYLLTEQLFDRYFSFNRLLLYNAPLAQKICHATDGDFMIEAMAPYLIIMTEVVEDMEAINGHDPVDDELCSHYDDNHSYHAHMIIERDKMEIYWEDLPADDFMLERMTSGRVCDIDAKAVLKLFEAKDYVDLLARIKERFHEETAYDDLVTYLRENKLVE